MCVCRCVGVCVCVYGDERTYSISPYNGVAHWCGFNTRVVQILIPVSEVPPTSKKDDV